MTGPTRCFRCGAPLADAAAGPVCPACLLKLGLAMPAAGAAWASSISPNKRNPFAGGHTHTAGTARTTARADLTKLVALQEPAADLAALIKEAKALSDSLRR